jgi:1-acyl-sn-glycerol-3-phosphate acyltransferase
LKKRSRLVKPFDWSLSSPIRGLRGDLQELLLFPILKVFARMRVEGRDRIEKAKGPFVIVSNHTSHFDCPVILAALPYRLRHKTIVAAAADYFYKFAPLGTFTSLALGTIPFERHESSRESLERCKEGIRRGWSVLLFPEGTRSQSGEMGEFKQGAAFLCVDTNCAALPVHLEGLEGVMPKGKSFPRPGKVKVRFGSPVGPAPSDDYSSFTSRLRETIAQLKTTEV